MDCSQLPIQVMGTNEDRDIIFSSTTRRDYFTKYTALHKAALNGNWEAAEILLNADPTLVRAQITRGKETALHIAALQGNALFVDNLLRRMDVPQDTEIQNDKGNTALCFAAVAGHVDIAKSFVGRNGNLPKIQTDQDHGVTPLYIAAFQGHNEMAKYLFSLSDGLQGWTEADKISLLTTCTESGLYDLAMSILDQDASLAVAEDINGETALQILARKPSAFCGHNRQGMWVNIANKIMCSMKCWKDEDVRNNPAATPDANTLFDCLWDYMMGQDDVEAGNVINANSLKLAFIAATEGNDACLVKLISKYPDFLYHVNPSTNHSIFHIAVSHRYVKIFNLIYELSGVTDLIKSYVNDNDNSNILHLAAKLSPQNQLDQIRGPALQMQREVLWFKEVEKIVQPSHKSARNSNGQTPYELFLEEHANLMKQGEKFMKQTAKACMLVTLLITTLVFTTAFTVPGGYNNSTGAPILQNNRWFMIFPISVAVATLSSLTSMVMFLSILTSRYKETDFLKTLPFWLVIGVAALLISVVAMMAEFCTCLLFFQHGLATIAVLPVLFAIVSIMFVILNYPLLGTILGCTFGSRFLFRSENRLF